MSHLTPQSELAFVLKHYALSVESIKKELLFLENKLAEIKVPFTFIYVLKTSLASKSDLKSMSHCLMWEKDNSLHKTLWYIYCDNLPKTYRELEKNYQMSCPIKKAVRDLSSSQLIKVAKEFPSFYQKIEEHVAYNPNRSLVIDGSSI